MESTRFFSVCDAELYFEYARRNNLTDSGIRTMFVSFQRSYSYTCDLKSF